MGLIKDFWKGIKDIFTGETFMKRFNIDDYKGKYVMHCKTKEESDKFLKYLDSVGRKWASGCTYDAWDNWGYYKESTCYAFNDDSYDSLAHFYSMGSWTVLEFSDFNWSDIFTKDALRDGMVVRTRHKGEFLVIGDVLLDEDDKFSLYNYKDNLIHYEDHDLDIMAVYSVQTCEVDSIYDLIYSGSCLKLIWEREEEKPKYKVGDRVKVKDDLSGKFRISIFPEMRSLAGKVLTVTSVRPDCVEGIAYRFEETRFGLTEDVIDCLVDYEEMTVSEIEKKLGYKVKIVDGE